MGTQASALSVVHLAPVLGGIAARPLDYLSRDEFARYIAACRACGATFNPFFKAQVTTADQVAPLVAALKAADFAVQLDPALAASLHEALESMRSEAASLRDLDQEMTDELAARGLSLRRYQAEGVAWLRSRTAGLLGDDPGLGKTVTLLMALQSRAPVVVICPAVAKGVWVKHVHVWRRGFYPSVLEGRNSFRWPLPNQVAVLNYDILPPIHGEKGAKVTAETRGTLLSGLAPRPGTIVIADEAHALKTPGALRSRRFRAMAKAVLATDGKVFLATGTPMLNRAPELWTLLSHIGCAEEAFGAWPQFVRTMGGRTCGGTIEWGTPAPESAERLRRVMLRRRRVDVLPDLPKKQHIDLPVALDAATRTLCDAVMAEMRAAGINLDQALNIASSASGFECMSKVRAALAISKIPAMIEAVNEIEATGEPQIVVSAHRKPIDMLGLRPGWRTITGDVSPNDRTAIEGQFQRGELKGLAMTIQAGGVAITLTRAYQMLFVDLLWTPALNSQCEDRICRIGQTRGVLIRRLVGDHELDELVAERLLEKQLRIEASVEAASVGEGAHHVEADAAVARLAGVLADVSTTTAPVHGVRLTPASDSSRFAPTR